MNDNGIQKAAILMLAIGEAEAAEVMKFLGPREVQKLGAAMATMKSVQHEQVVTVLDASAEQTELNSTVGLDSDEYIRQVLTKALGDDKASVLLSRILGGKDATGIESLKWMDASSVSELIRNEHPQIIATILVHLERDQACEILGNFTDRLRNDVVLRIATLDGVQPAALRELNDVLTKLLSGNENIKKSSLGGVRAAAEILNFMSGEQEGSVMDNIKNYDNDMAQKIMDEMFVFDNIIDIDDRGIQLLLREVQSEMLIIALKGASQDLREKIFKNMSPARRRDDARGPRIERPGAPVRGRGAAEADPADRAPPGRRRPDRVGRKRRGFVCLIRHPKELQTAYQRWEMNSFGDDRPSVGRRAAPPPPARRRLHRPADEELAAIREQARAWPATKKATPPAMPTAWRSAAPKRPANSNTCRRSRSNSAARWPPPTKPSPPTCWTWRCTWPRACCATRSRSSRNW